MPSTKSPARGRSLPRKPSPGRSRSTSSKGRRSKCEDSKIPNVKIKEENIIVERKQLQRTSEKGKLINNLTDVSVKVDVSKVEGLKGAISSAFAFFKKLSDLVDIPFQRIESFTSANAELIKYLKYLCLVAFSGFAVYHIWKLQQELTKPVFGIPAVDIQINTGKKIAEEAISQLGLGGVGAVLACFGHTVVYSTIFAVAFLYWTLYYTIFSAVISYLILPYFGLSDMIIGGLQLTVWILIAQVVLSYLRAVGTVNKLFDYIPEVVSFVVTFTIAWVDQTLSCQISNIYYNRLAMNVGWFAFAGIIHPPLNFCVDDRAFGVRDWPGAYEHCPQPCSHLDILNCICKADLGCSNDTSCFSYCETIIANIFRVFSHEVACLSVGHFMFASLLYAITFQALYRLQKRAIIHGTVYYGLYLWSNYAEKSTGILTVISYVTGTAVATCMSYPVLVEFQNKVSCRLTRSIGLDLSPPDSTPLSPYEAWSVFVASWRTILKSAAYGFGIIIIVFMYRVSLVFFLNGHLGMKVPPPTGFCTTMKPEWLR